MSLPKVPELELIPETTLKPEEWAKCIRRYMEHSKKTLRKNCNKAGKIEVETCFDMESSLVNRRTQAILNTRDEIIKHSDCCYDDWIMTNTQSDSYGAIEEYNRLLYAASIWILDRIMETGIDDKELYKLLPTDDHLLDDLFQIDVWDSCYEEDLIVSVEYVLHYRNRDIAPMEDNGHGDHRVYTSRLAAEGKDRADVPSRQAFEKLLALIPQEKINQAVQQFTDCFWAWVDRFFAGAKVLDEEAERVRLKVNEQRKKINEQQRKIDKLVRAAEAERAKFKHKKNEPKKAPVVNPLLARPIVQDEKYSVVSSFRSSGRDYSEQAEFVHIMSEIERLHDMDDRNQELAEEYKEQIKRKGVYSYYMSHAGTSKMPEYDDVFTENVLKALPPLPAFDCYGMCFALLYLIEQGSDLPWLYGACTGLMREVILCLPWGVSGYDELDDEFWDEDIPPQPLKPVDIPDWYERKYAVKSKDADTDMQRSLAQIVYETTGCIMPRDMHRYDNIVKELNRYGLRGNNVNAVLYSMLALSYSRRRMRAHNFDDWYMNPYDPEAEKKKLTPEQLEKKISAQQQEIRRLQAELHSAEKSASDANKKLADFKEKTESERRELADLRERLFYNEVDESAEEVVDQSRFPYEVQKDTIIFGGHATFLKAIRQLLKGNIRYVDREQSFDVTMIRHADVLWIQPNAIAHKQFYKIADEARKYNKPMRYFQYASASKCAEQVVENDQT